MSLVITHGFVSPSVDGPDATKLRPSNWGSAATVTPTHVFGGGAQGSLLMRDTVPLDGGSWIADVALGQVLASGGVGAAPAFTATPTLTTLTLGVNPALTGLVMMPNAQYLSARNATNTADKRLIGLNASNQVWLDPDATGLLFGSPLYAPDGTSLLPAFSFVSETTLGFYRSSAGTLRFVGGVAAFNGQISALVNVAYANNGTIFTYASGNGLLTVANSTNTIGSDLNVQGLPTVASGFGTSPSVTAGSTPFAGSVNVGGGGVATSGVINFNGTAFPSAPFVVCMNTTTGAVVRATSSTTQLTITAPVAFSANDVICWICISSK